VLCLLISTVHTFRRLKKNITQIDIDPVARTLNVRRDISLCSCLGVRLDETHPIERLTDIWLHLDKVRDECGLHDQRVSVCLNVSRPRPQNTATSTEWTLQTWMVIEEGCNLDHAPVALETCRPIREAICRVMAQAKNEQSFTIRTTEDTHCSCNLFVGFWAAVGMGRGASWS